MPEKVLCVPNRIGDAPCNYFPTSNISNKIPIKLGVAASGEQLTAGNRSAHRQGASAHRPPSPDRGCATVGAMFAWESLDALSHALELCRVDRERRVVVILDDQIDRDRAGLVRAAVARTGADALEVQPIRASDPQDQSLLLLLASKVDLIITSSPGHAQALADTGPRVLLLEPDASPHVFPPHANLRLRVKALVDQIDRSEALHITDDFGTALDFALARATTTFDYGLVGETNPNATFPAGWVSAQPGRGCLNGSLVVLPGDGNVTAERHISSPVKIEIVDDYISAIHGDSADADIIRALLEYTSDPAAYGAAQVVFGLNPGTRRVQPFDAQLLHPQLSQLAAGVITVSFGENETAERACEPPVTMRFSLASRTATVDGLPIAARGILQGDYAPDVYETTSAD